MNTRTERSRALKAPQGVHHEGCTSTVRPLQRAHPMKETKNVLPLLADESICEIFFLAGLSMQESREITLDFGEANPSS